jgi:hypothetical protein
VVGAWAVGLGTNTEPRFAPTCIAAFLPAGPFLLFVAAASTRGLVYLSIVGRRFVNYLMIFVLVAVIVGGNRLRMGTTPGPPFAPTGVAILQPACPVLSHLADPFALGPEDLPPFAAVRTYLHDHERVLHERIRAIPKG